jgi:hypothetical protein
MNIYDQSASDIECLVILLRNVKIIITKAETNSWIKKKVLPWVIPFGGWHGYIISSSLFLLARVRVIPLGHIFSLRAVEGRLFWFSIATVLFLLVAFLDIRSKHQIKLV